MRKTHMDRALGAADQVGAGEALGVAVIARRGDEQAVFDFTECVCHGHLSRVFGAGARGFEARRG